MKTLTLVCSVALVTACSSTNSSRDSLPEGLPDSTLDSAAQEPDDSGYLPTEGASWFGVEGAVHYEAAETTVTLTVHFYEDQETSNPICSASTEPVRLVSYDLTPDPTVHYWASTRALQTLDGSLCFDSTRLPQVEVQLGFGELHAAVLPILEANGLGDVAVNPDARGSYIGFNETPPTEQDLGTAFVLGYALSETDELNNPEGTPPSTVIRGLFLFPLSELESDTGPSSTQ